MLVVMLYIARIIDCFSNSDTLSPCNLSINACGIIGVIDQ